MTTRRLKNKSFLADYHQGDYLLKPEKAIGRPGILRARDPRGDDVLIKVWPRAKGVEDKDLEDIWRSELRQLHRLSALPRAEELFVPIRGGGKDEQGFYLVLDPGQGSPLDRFLNAGRLPEMLARARQPRSRHSVWANVDRLAEGLELLHSQGAVHRNIDPWAVVTALTPEADFRLTGFEWSMRIASMSGRVDKNVDKLRFNQPVSFARDWNDLALLAAHLLHIQAARLNNPKLVPSDVAEHASAAEIRLLRAMVGLEKVERLDGAYVRARIGEILDAIENEAAGREARLCLALRFGPDSGLSRAIRLASGQQIETDQHDDQVRFIEDDLGALPLFMTLKTNRFALVGKQLTYLISPFRNPRGDDEPTWEFAFCDRADADVPAHATLIGKTAVPASGLELVAIQTAAQTFPRRRGKVQHWEDLISRAKPPQERKTELDHTHQALALLLVLEMAYATADMFPVEILKSPAKVRSDSHSLHVVSRNDLDRAKLSDVLQIDTPAARLLKMIEGDEGREEGGWILAEPKMLGEFAPGATNWSFVGRKEIDGQECLEFAGQGPIYQSGHAFLSPAGMAGRIAQFRRRLKALSALRQHTELLTMLADPRGRLHDSHDRLEETDGLFEHLDNSKKAALREIIATIPLFLLQGPPGVGKTYLAGDLVRRQFEEEPTTRMLLSAQSNSAIDHLMNEVKDVFGKLEPEQRPLIIRARPIDDDDSSGEFEIDYQADAYLRALSGSPIADSAPQHLRDRLQGLAEARSKDASRLGGKRRMSADLRAFEGMILRAANLVFATTNSYAVERLIDDRSLFDWSIVEEAGKATGGELVSPLLLSHRRLMIGDHKQLPPFDVDKIARLLASETKVKEAVRISADLISRYLKEPAVEEVFSEVEYEARDLGAVCGTTLNILTLFETLIEAELNRQKVRPGGKPIARRLNEQYRMHPAIARIVSHCFYDGELVTNAAKTRDYIANPPPFASKDPKRLPDLPIVFVDMPYSRHEQPGGRSGERAPPWSNPDEAAAAMTALQLVRAQTTGKAPSLAILSPYKQQVNLLRSKLNNYMAGGSLAHIRDFSAAVAENDYCGTVDSFQGAEADLVMISLVRNNAHSTASRALGFLRDNRRMNVLLSRAKWRLILFGSLAFYRHVIATSAPMPDQEVGFLAKFLDALESASDAKEAAILPLAKLNGIVP